MTKHAEWDAEKRWLSYVLQIVAERLADARRLGGDYARRAKEELRSLWASEARNIASYDDWYEAAQAAAQIEQGQRGIAFYHAQAKKLERLLEAPYFGRVDFREKGCSKVDSIYIGIASLHHPTNDGLLVYDWRAPISSLFYDAEPGVAQYECQEGNVTGEMLLKRQYRIVHGELKFMFDTDLKIDDDVLQELLARNIDDKMRTIVSSIQREQNRVIRDSRHHLLVVQGPAGSGKTAIALHRAAYLLYKYRDSLTAKGIVIFSPNRVFSDYISAVLPELGEENVVQTSFLEYAEEHLGNRPVEDMYTQLEWLLSAASDQGCSDRALAIKYKASSHFFAALNRYAQLLDEGLLISFFPVKVQDKVVMSQEEMANLFQRYRDLPLARRLEKIRQRALFLLGPLEEQRLKEWKEILTADPEYRMDWEIRQESKRRTLEEFAPVKSALESWASFDVVSLYRRLFQDSDVSKRVFETEGYPPQWDRISKCTLATLVDGPITYEDTWPLLYLKHRLTGAPVLSAVRHVIIDEAQDYTPLQYALVRLVFPDANMTIVGDLNQSVHPLMHIVKYEDVMSALEKEKATLVRLKKSYRSTRQIMAFARALLNTPDDVEVVQRDGPIPSVAHASSFNHLADMVANDIQELQGKGLPSVAVLCKTAAQSVRLHQQLQQRLGNTSCDSSSAGIRLITAHDSRFQTGAVVLPVYLAKGLEFDAVILADVSESCYGSEWERGLLYTACTRALHELRMYYTGTLSPLISAVDSSLVRL